MDRQVGFWQGLRAIDFEVVSMAQLIQVELLRQSTSLLQTQGASLPKFQLVDSLGYKLGDYHSTEKKSKIAVLYLARKAEGIAPIKKFLTSYKKHPAGIEHDLVVIFKGFENENDCLSTKEEFSSLPHISIELIDEGFDLGSYFLASNQITHDYICCINTFSEILSDHWLAKLYSHASKPDVGLVGATGSYESISDFITLFQKIIWLNSNKIPIPFKKKLNLYFNELLPGVFSEPPLSFFDSPYLYTRKKLKCIIQTLLRRFITNFDNQAYLNWWKKVKTIEDIATMCEFPSFPNPHIRSNVFMLKRERFLALKRNPFLKKIDACLFESGPQSMTRQIIEAKLKAKIVGDDGKGYDLKEWDQSRTFRLDKQQNLLARDNQTQVYAKVTKETQITQTLLTWGDRAVKIPDDFPDMGYNFKTHF